MNIQWGLPDDQLLDRILALAAKHQLVLYDPQGPEVHQPVRDERSDLVNSPEASESSGKRVLGASVGLVYGALIVIGGSLLSMEVARWAVIAVGMIILLISLLALLSARRSGSG